MRYCGRQCSLRATVASVSRPLQHTLVHWNWFSFWPGRREGNGSERTVREWSSRRVQAGKQGHYGLRRRNINL